MYLLDTTVLSEGQRRRPDPGVARFLREQPGERLFTSVIVVGELAQGAARHPDPARREALARWLAEDVIVSLGSNILPITWPIARRWGELRGAAARRGETLPVVDALIAATALDRDLTVVTRNVGDIERCGARVFNPWTPGNSGSL